ncbi:hypothetical protein Glove_78g173 [Diversispora epigaea]|uniref:Uncharacterized protein n=1 Tax=Diversispora epigaea TaxID=1348612 RepID=A0A397J8Q3_9GLOM|nr:hypothetical protein Glove_78g173 [Diversispora epigaea]
MRETNYKYRFVKTREYHRISELEQIAKDKNELEVRIAELEQTTKLSQTENTKLKVEIEELKRAVKIIKKHNRSVTNDLNSPVYPTPLPNRGCSNRGNVQVIDSSIHHGTDNSVTTTCSDELKTLEDKAVDDFVNSKYKETVSKEIIQNIFKVKNAKLKVDFTMFKFFPRISYNIYNIICYANQNL